MTFVRSIVVAAAVVAVASACGSGGGGGGKASASELAQGKEVFVKNCGTCHSLSAAGTKGIVGGPLDGAGLSASTVEKRVRDGGGGMPSFRDALSDHQIAAVAAFVADATG